MNVLDVNVDQLVWSFDLFASIIWGFLSPNVRKFLFSNEDSGVLYHFDSLIKDNLNNNPQLSGSFI